MVEDVACVSKKEGEKKRLLKDRLVPWNKRKNSPMQKP